jgi:hypothetical protein
MYGTSRVLDLRYLREVRKFITAVKVHRDRSKRSTIICPCSHCKNRTTYVDEGTVQSHLIRYGFVENYMVWTRHGERVAASSGGASGVSSASTTLNQDPVVAPVLASAAPAGSENSARDDYITVDDILQNMADGGGDDGEDLD